MESESSPKEGSNASRGTLFAPLTLALADSRKEEREEGRSGVVGLEGGLREVEVERTTLLLPV